MKIYLAGPMRGIAKFNAPAFDRAAARLRAQGHEVFSPAEQDRKLYGDAVHEGTTGKLTELESAVGFSRREIMKLDMTWICENADAIALLPGWQQSAGANAELTLAKFLGLTVLELGEEYTK